MAVYKVPQDVEAEDHLIGPFGFRQFIYLIIVAFSCFVAYLLSQIFIGLILIPLPFILFFGAIALPLRKDQPTEVYLAAILQFNLKSKKRLWQPDGIRSTVTITAPKKVEERRTKDISQADALDRLGHLAQIMDTRGWAARGVFNPDLAGPADSQLSDHVIAEAASAEDILGSEGTSSQSFDRLIDQQKAISRQTAVSRMSQAGQVTDSAQPPASAAPVPQTETAEDVAALANPRVATIHQRVIAPLSDDSTLATVPPAPPKSTSETEAKADIIKELANTPDFSIATIAEEVHRRVEKQSDEVEIKLH